MHLQLRCRGAGLPLAQPARLKLGWVCRRRRSRVTAASTNCSSLNRETIPCLWVALTLMSIREIMRQSHKALMGTSRSVELSASLGSVRARSASRPKIFPELQTEIRVWGSARGEYGRRTRPTLSRTPIALDRTECPPSREPEWYRVSPALASEQRRERLFSLQPYRINSETQDV
jgi:hypothetical protein